MNKKRNMELKNQIKELTNESGFVTFYKHPQIDFLFGLTSGNHIPTKQDAFKPLVGVEIADDGSETPLNDLYAKSDVSKSIQKFTADIKQVASQTFNEINRIKKPHLVEVIISVSTLGKRFREVDVDNLAKCILDGLNGIAFDDDSQVSSLLCKKFVHEMGINSVMIGITAITEERKGLTSDVKLFSTIPYE
ncbi:RusA family crossover junction endodeoxyribonuclease [Pedobacter sp. GSP4]|uniref:RusA family crossover junction endodeoxyribonuclease n=1 Tax=Pedobacter sp. GSP4 TaxID=3453716 RepID=UPI003EE9EA7E